MAITEHSSQNHEHLATIDDGTYREFAEGYHQLYDDGQILACDDILAEHIRQLIALQMHLRGTDRIIMSDGGAGTSDLEGWQAAFLEQHPSMTFSSFDYERSMVLAANQRTDLRPNTIRMQADMHDMPYQSGALNIFTMTYGPASYSFKPDSLFAECNRVLAADGFLLASPYTIRTLPKDGVAQTTIQDTNHSLFYTRDHYQEILEGAGFENVDVVGLNWFGYFIERLNPEQLQQFELFISEVWESEERVQISDFQLFFHSIFEQSLTEQPLDIDSEMKVQQMHAMEQLHNLDNLMHFIERNNTLPLRELNLAVEAQFGNGLSRQTEIISYENPEISREWWQQYLHIEQQIALRNGWEPGYARFMWGVANKPSTSSVTSIH